MEKTNKKAAVSSSTDKKEKRRIKKWPFIVGGVVLAVIIAVVLLVTLAKPKADTSVLSTEVSKNDIVSTVTGTGSLTSDEALDIELPVGLEIEEVLVSEGDMVNEGDPIAVVNTASVLSLIETVQDELEDIDTKINKAENETTSESVKTYVSGRVKEILVSVGDSASAAVGKHGALMVLSIDGNMKVSVEAEIAEGTGVTVLLSDNTEVKGVVAASANGVSEIVFSDEFGTVGEQAAVKDGSSTLGTGTVEISEPFEIIAPSGTVSEIYVDVNDKVSSGKALLKLADVAASAEYQQYLDERSNLLGILRTLSSLASDGVLRAPFSGIVGSLYISDNSEVSASGAASAGAAGADSAASYYSWMSADDVSEPTVTLLAASAEPVTILDLSAMDFAAPAAGAVPVTLIEDIPAFKAEIKWTPEDAVFAANTVYTAEFTLTANAGFTFPANIVPELKDKDDATVPAMITDTLVTGDGEGNVLTFKAVFAPASGSTGSGTDGSTGSTGSTGGIGSIGGSYIGSYIGSSSYSSASASTSDVIESAVGLTLAPVENIRISISVDELDILAIELGQRATVEIDALEGELFEGVITDIANNATSSGGTAKYTVEITLPRAANMKNGMSATATVITAEHLGVMTIPTDAIQEQGNRVFVYTYVDNDGVLGGEVDIKTGVSDGKNTEVVSGIAAGDTVYYFSTEIDPMTQMFNMMMGGNMPEGGGNFGGEMPDGNRPEGERPQGGGMR